MTGNRTEDRIDNMFNELQEVRQHFGIISQGLIDLSARLERDTSAVSTRLENLEKMFLSLKETGKLGKK